MDIDFKGREDQRSAALILTYAMLKDMAEESPNPVASQHLLNGIAEIRLAVTLFNADLSMSQLDRVRRAIRAAKIVYPL
jgi:hypothetical protein